MGEKMSYNERQNELAKYKWEFLRRNDEYIRDWEEMNEGLIEKYGYDYEYTLAIPPDEEFELCNKWGIDMALCPHDARPPGTEKIEWLRSAISDQGRDRGVRKGHVAIMVDGKVRCACEMFPETGVMKIEIDLNFSKRKLKEEFSAFIDKWKTVYEREFEKVFAKRFCEEKTSKDADPGMSCETKRQIRENAKKACKEEIARRRSEHQCRLDLRRFDEYLEVWDLKKKGGLSWSEIAQRLFPEDVNGVQTAKNYFRAIDRFVKNPQEVPL
jgi:hypothetical protein